MPGNVAESSATFLPGVIPVLNLPMYQQLFGQIEPEIRRLSSDFDLGRASPILVRNRMFGSISTRFRPEVRQSCIVIGQVWGQVQSNSDRH